MNPSRAALPPRLAAEVYLIGCGAGPVGEGTPSALTMGFKAWNLLRMSGMGLPVPPAFVLGTHYCLDPAARQRAACPALWQPALDRLALATGLGWGNARRPLLVSVRSGAPVSMPGMMDTLLNIGLCDSTITGLLRQTGNPRLVWDAYRRLVSGYGEVVAGIPSQHFEAAAASLNAAGDAGMLDFTQLRALTQRFLQVYASVSGHAFPQSPDDQLTGAIGAVLASWESVRARAYREAHQVADTIGTAVTVQAMIFGNGGGRSGAGVGFTRDPDTGAPHLFVDFLFNAQGEDVVSGRRSAPSGDPLASVLPDTWQALVDAAATLERAFGDMQDFEFTVQDSQLFLLQTRTGQRTRRAAARIALDLFDAQQIDRATALSRTAALDRAALRLTRLVTDSGTPLVALAQAVAAGGGVASGEIALDRARATTRAAAHAAVILVRRDADTNDIAAIERCAGLLSQQGARTSHAAVVARQLGKVCLIGCSDLHIDLDNHTLHIGHQTLQEGDVITLDGNSGQVYAGAVHTAADYPADLLRRLKVLRARVTS